MRITRAQGATMALAPALAQISDDPDLAPNFAARRQLPAAPATFASFPEQLDEGFESTLPPIAAVTAPMSLVRFDGRNAETWEAKGRTSAERFDHCYTDEEFGEWVPRIEEMAERAEELHLLIITNNRSQGPDKCEASARGAAAGPASATAAHALATAADDWLSLSVAPCQHCSRHCSFRSPERKRGRGQPAQTIQPSPSLQSRGRVTTLDRILPARCKTCRVAVITDCLAPCGCIRDEAPPIPRNDYVSRHA